jgi:hypothetical protein
MVSLFFENDMVEFNYTTINGTNVQLAFHNYELKIYIQHEGIFIILNADNRFKIENIFVEDEFGDMVKIDNINEDDFKFALFVDDFVNITKEKYLNRNTKYYLNHIKEITKEELDSILEIFKKEPTQIEIDRNVVSQEREQEGIEKLKKLLG